MLVLRVDNRLVHGQIIEGWLPYTGAKHLVVVNDAMAANALCTQIMGLAVPSRVQLHVVRVAEAVEVIQRYKAQKVLVLFENVKDLLKVVQDEPLSSYKPDFWSDIKCINIGNLHHAKNKTQIMEHISVTEQEITLLKELAKKFTLDFRCIPSEKSRGLHELSL